MKNKIREIARLVKRAIRVSQGRDAWFRADPGFRIAKIGSGYGTWSIVPELVSPGELAFCFGLGREITFEIELAKRFRMRVCGFDPTPESVAWIGKQVLPESLELYPVGLADTDGILEFSAPRAAGEVSLSTVRGEGVGVPTRLPVARLATLLELHSANQPLSLLKMDIEGSEYVVIEQLVASSIRPRQLLIEFHHRFAEVGIAATTKAVERLRGIGYRLAHVSASGEEFTFILHG